MGGSRKSCTQSLEGDRRTLFSSGDQQQVDELFGQPVDCTRADRELAEVSIELASDADGRGRPHRFQPRLD